MKNQIPPLSECQLTALAKALGDTSFGLSGSDINHLLEQAGIPNPDPEHTKWKRLYNAFATFQNRKQCSNNILNFCKYALDPAKNITNPNYDWLLSQTNQALLFIGHKIS